MFIGAGIGGGSYWAGRARLLAPEGRAYLWPAHFWARKEAVTKRHSVTHAYQFHWIQELKDAVCQ